CSPQKAIFRAGFEANGTKNTFFEKRTGEVVENKGKLPKNEPETNLKQSGEVVENTCLWKKRTGTKLKTNRAILLKIGKSLKKRTGHAPRDSCRPVAHSCWPTSLLGRRLQ
ncbi:MAG TPA: hypothetical protein VFQ24_17345, partial [Terriglobia bacterium]|nr:hypothetical protein [Terriglobia bacterium]